MVGSRQTPRMREKTEIGLRVGSEGDTEDCLRLVCCVGDCIPNICNDGKETPAGLWVGNGLVKD